MKRIEDKVFKIIQENVDNRNLKILELTPGRGYLTEVLLNHGYRNIEVLDIHPENFRTRSVICHKGNLNNPLPFDGKSFDLVISVEGIEHLENQYQLASEISRILRDGGQAIITTPNITNFASRVRFLLTGFYSLAARPSSEFEKDWTIEHIYPVAFWQLRHMFHTNGLFIQGVYTDRIRRSALTGLVALPFSLVFTWISLRKEVDPRQKSRNREILRQMHRPEIYFGRTQIILARKSDCTYEKAT